MLKILVHVLIRIAVIVGLVSADSKIYMFEDGVDVKKLMTDYVNAMYPAGEAELQSLRPLFTNLEDPLHRSANTPEKWEVPSCSNIGLSLVYLKTLTEDRRVTVSKMADSRTNESYVLKVFTAHKHFAGELNFLKRANHTSISRPLCTMRVKDRIGFIVPFLSCETVSKVLQKIPTTSLSEKSILDYGAQLVDVVLYMHWLGFTHSDLKQPHIVVNKPSEQLYLLDFEENVQLPRQNDHKTLKNVRAPELVLDYLGPTMENIDWFAVGALIAQWHSIHYEDWDNKGRWFATKMYSNMMVLQEVPLGFSQPLRQLLFYLLHPDPSVRTINTVSQVEWFQSLPYWSGVDWNLLRGRWG